MDRAPSAWWERMCQHETQWQSRHANCHELGIVECHHWSGPYSISGMPSMISEKQPHLAVPSEAIKTVKWGPSSAGYCLHATLILRLWEMQPNSTTSFLISGSLQNREGQRCCWSAVLSQSQLHFKMKNVVLRIEAATLRECIRFFYLQFVHRCKS